MSIDYISGFFDADGSILIANSRKNSPYKTISITFTNTELQIIQNIQTYLLQQYNVKGYISKKTPKKSNHKTCYSLSYPYTSAEILCRILKSNHPKKAHRINVFNKYYQSITNRNGKYSVNEHSRKLAFERLFNWSTL